MSSRRSGRPKTEDEQPPFCFSLSSLPQYLLPFDDQPLPPPLPRCWNPLSAACRTTWEYTLSCTLMFRFFKSARSSCPTSISPRLPAFSFITTSSRSLVSTPLGDPFV